MKIANNKKFYILPQWNKKKIPQGKHFTFYILIIITLLSCTTEPQTGSLSGNIYLEGEEEHSGITVALYDLAELDQEVIDINEKYPFIGVKLSSISKLIVHLR